MQSTPYTVPTLVSGLVAATTALYVFRKRRHVTAALEYAGIALCLAEMCLAYAGELSSATLEAKLTWLDLRYLGICAVPMMSLLFAIRWRGYDRWLTRRRVAALALVPAIALLLAWTNEHHHLMGGPSTLVQRPGYTLRVAEGRVAFWIFLLYAYACVLGTLALYLDGIVRSPPHRLQGSTLVVSTLVPWAANVLFVFFGDSIDRGYDVTHVGYGLQCLVWTYALTRRRLFDLVPIARERVFESLADAALVLDSSGRIIDHNPAAARALGREASLVGSPLASLVGEETARAILQGGEVALLGQVLEVTSSRVRAAHGGDATVLILRDVTDRRRIEAAREEALRLAEASSRAKDQFLARMSHEVRNPLHGVVGAVDLLLTSPLAPDQKRYAEAVSASSAALLSLVDELLDFSKLDAERVHVEVADLDARGCLDEVALLFAGAAERKRLRISVEAPEALPVRADAVRLRQVLANLVGNAVKFTDAGSIDIVGQVAEHEVRLEVRDSGVGIAPGAHAQIFEPFVQLSAAPRNGIRGTGLGLSIARRIVTLMGGRMGVDSAVGAGSVFWFTLPRAERSARPQDRTGPAPLAVFGPRRGEVLVVEDDEVNQLVTRGLLEREGCRVAVAPTGMAALALLAERRFALVLTDVRMPTLTGHDLAAELRRREPAGQRTPVVALTADVYESAREHALETGMDDWLAKPVDPEQLRRVLDRWVPRLEAERTSPGKLKDFFAAQPEVYARVMQAYQRSAPADVTALLDAASRRDWPALRERAHTLKGAAMLVGDLQLEEVCARLCNTEGSALEADLAGLQAAAERLTKQAETGTLP